MANLEREVQWKDLILRYLGTDDNSISGIMKQLKSQGVPVHRLILTGYLNAMVDLGILREKIVKPARIFTPDLPHSRDVYRAVGKVCDEVAPEDQADAALSTLYFLFGRPVFIREVERCDVGIPRKYSVVQTMQRSVYIEKLAEAGVKIPPNNILIEPTEKSPGQVLYKCLRGLILSSFDLGKYSIYSDSQQQTTLD